MEPQPVAEPTPAGCAEVDGEVRERLKEVAEAEVPAAADREHWAKCLAHDAACLPFGMVGEPRRKLGPITTLVLLLSMGVDLMDFRVSAEFPSLRQRAAAFPAGKSLRLRDLLIG